MDPMEVPAGAWVIHGQDPQSAIFALVSMRSTQDTGAGPSRPTPTVLISQFMNRPP
jgi:hypothetical protein